MTAGSQASKCKWSLLHLQSSRPETHWDATYYPIILEIEQKNILRLKYKKYI